MARAQTRALTHLLPVPFMRSQPGSEPRSIATRERAPSRPPSSGRVARPSAPRRSRSGCALVSTAAVPVARPFTPANIAANPMLAFVTAIRLISSHTRPPVGFGRPCTVATPRRAKPATSARSAANHSTGASRSPHRIVTKHAPQTAETHNIRPGRGCPLCPVAPASVASTGGWRREAATVTPWPSRLGSGPSR